MAIKIQSYYKTTEMDEAQLKDALLACRNQDYKIYKLFSTFGRMTTWDVFELYNDMIGPILQSSVGRSINTLKRNGVIIDGGNIQGPLDRPVTLYVMVDNPPSELQSFNKSIPLSVSIDVVLDDEGHIDVDKMYDELAEKIIFLTNKFNV